jgi:hypothetical protein
MVRLALAFCFLVVFFASVVPGLSLGFPAASYSSCFPAVQPCAPIRPAPPVVQTMQVDVPVPCPPVGCGAPLPCQQRLCGPFACSPPLPTRPVQVRLDVVVRPERPNPCAPQSGPQRFCCENPPIFEPIFYQAAGLVQSLIAAPLALGERFMAHPVPMPMPAPTPVPCWRMPAPPCPPCFQTLPSTQCMAPCSPPLRCRPQGPPVKARPLYGPVPSRTHPQNGLFPR